MTPVQRHLANEETTVLTVSAKATVEELLAAIKEFNGPQVTGKLLWDISKADLSGLTMAQLHQVLTTAKSYSHLRPNGKTAILVSGALGFGLGRMYETLCELDQHPIPLAVFKEMDEAMAWLGS